MQVELATRDDISAWLVLADEVSELFGADMAHDVGFREGLERNIQRGTAFCVRIDGEFAGAMIFNNDSIHWLAVSKRFRHRGVGAALVRRATQTATTRVRVITFGEGHPHPDASAARALYRALGFVETHEDPGVVPDRTPREVLAWSSVRLA
jgi:ribosomal protein S18 acetylase RimI-like enzyme